MKLVNEKEFASASKLDKVGLGRLSGALMNALKLSDLNELYDKCKDKEGVEFIDALFKEIHVEFTYFPEELSRIPKNGAFITVSNHPLGGVDGIILIKLLANTRPDYKVMVNFLLQKIEPLKEFFMPVNPFDNIDKSSLPGLKEAIQHVKDGHGLGIFPAGEVATYNFEQGKIADKQWQEGAIKLIRKMDVPVVPVYFKARNSFWFYFLSGIHPILRTAKLPSEVFNKRNKSIQVRIGNPILPKEWAEMDVNTTKHFLRRRTYLLAKTLPPRKSVIPRPDFTFLSRRKHDAPQPIIDAANYDVVEAEVDALRAQGKRMVISKNYEVFLAKYDEIPAAMHEIGRLREITFRSVGEGTNLPIDIDEFDHHYHHLFLWDAEAKKICGAYRMGLGQHIYPVYGMKGFYVPTLFKIDKPAEKLFSEGIEMGRAFITKEYQQKPMPLYLLWKGIIHVVLRNPGHRYLNGCVSISNDFSKFSKELMIEFVKQYYYDEDMGRYIHPRKAFKSSRNREDMDFALDNTKEDLNKLDRLISDVEPQGLHVPVLLKKYIKQNARIVAFNVDPKFNNSLDGFIYIDINDLPEQTVKPVLEELVEEAEKLKWTIDS